MLKFISVLIYLAQRAMKVLLTLLIAQSWPLLIGLAALLILVAIL